jgi:tripartite-type tricarboxylate transporter receptor subunit TctC
MASNACSRRTSSAAAHVTSVITIAMAACQPAFGQTRADLREYPVKPIRFVVGFPPGGGNDTIARMVGQKLSERLGQTIVIDNRAGAGGVVAGELAAHAPPDGYTMLMMSSSLTIQRLIRKDLRYDPIRDFIGVARLAAYRSVLVAHPSVAATSVRELIALAKAKPGALNFASSGYAVGSHLASELFKIAAHVDITHVPYKGTAPASSDLISGRVQLMFAPVVPLLPHVQSGRLRALAVTSSSHSRVMPELPTISEAGVPGYEFVGWYGIVVPVRTPRHLIEQLNAGVLEVMQSRDITARLDVEDMEFERATPDAFNAMRAAEVAKWEKIFRQVPVNVE